MKVAYLLNRYPCKSETFAAREMRRVQDRGIEIVVFAAGAEDSASDPGCCGEIYYRPSRLSIRAVQSVCYASTRRPLGVCRLLGLGLRLALSCPREAASLLANVHTICWFARCLDGEKARHVHAYFLSWPAVIGLGLSAVTGCSLSIGAHARDIFVEQGDVTLKVSRARFVIACTQQGLRQLKAALAPSHHPKLLLNYHGVDVNGSRPRGPEDAPEGGSDPIVIAVGRFVPKKGFDVLATAFADILRHHPGCHLVIVGDGPERQKLRRLIHGMDLGDSVQLAGWQDSECVRRLIGEATVLAVPSIVAEDGDRDGIPNVVLEAFAAGTPVVASNLPAISEAVEHGRTGLLAPPGDAPALGAAVRRLLEDRSLGDRLARNAFETLATRFNAEHAARRLADCFLEVDA